MAGLTIANAALGISHIVFLVTKLFILQQWDNTRLNQHFRPLLPLTQLFLPTANKICAKFSDLINKTKLLFLNMKYYNLYYAS